MNFSTIMQDQNIRNLVQERTLQRTFRDALHESTMFRTAATPIMFEGGLGDNRTITRSGELEPTLEPLVPGEDAPVSVNSHEQWDVRPQQLGTSMDVHMPTNALALASLVVERGEVLATHAGRSLSRLSRNKLYNKSLSGRCLNTAAVAASVNVPVDFLEGFTRARANTGLAVRYEPVSPTNPLSVLIYDTGSAAYVSRTVVGYTPDTAGDEVGPGTLVLNSAVTIATADHEHVAYDATQVVRVATGGGLGLSFSAAPQGINEITSADTFTLAAIRSMVRRLRNTHIAPFPDGYYRGYLDSTSEAQLFADSEAQALFREVPDHYEYKKMAIGVLLGVIWHRAEECPQPGSVGPNDPIALRTTNDSGVVIHRPIVVGKNCLDEHFIDMAQMITEAGYLGKTKEYNVSSDGIVVNTDRIQFIMRKPIDRLQQISALTWAWQGDFVIGTDGVDGDIAGQDVARYKRMVVCEHGS